jgi:CBS domain-containing protein
MDRAERIEVRIRRILAPEGQSSVEHSVYCPLRAESKPLEDCEVCERCTHLSPEESFLVCELPASARDTTAHSMARISRRFVERLLQSTPIGEVMAREVLCVTGEMSADAVSALLLERGISGVPVVDAQGFPFGIVSKTDLVRQDVAGRTASEVMTPVAFTLDERRPVSDAVKLLLTEGVHRLPVVDQDGRVTGILSAMDVLRWLDA